MSNSEGRFTIALPRGRFKLEAHANVGTGEAEVVVEDGSTEITIRLAS